MKKKREILAAIVMLLGLFAFAQASGQEKKNPSNLLPTGSQAKSQITAEVLGLINLSDNLASINVQINYLIPDPGMSNLVIEFPKEVNITRVQGQFIRTQDIIQLEDKQQLKIALTKPVRDEWTLFLTYEKYIPKDAKSLDFPFLELKGVKSTEAVFGLEASANLEIKIGPSENIKQLDLSQIPDSLSKQTQSVILLGFAYSALGEPGIKRSLTFELTRYQDVQVIDAIIDDARYLTLCLQDGFCITKGIFSVRNKSRQYLKIQLPQDAKIWSAFLVDNPVRPSRNADGEFLVPLTRSDLGLSGIEDFPVEIVYVNPAKQWGAGGRTAMELPKLDLVVREMNWFMFLPDKYQYQNFSGLELVPEKKGGSGAEMEIKDALNVFSSTLLAPSFLKFKARARQVEAKENLSAIFSAQKAHQEKLHAYSETFDEAGWAPKTSTRYQYYMGKDFIPANSPDQSESPAKRVIKNTRADVSGFQTFAIGNIDADPVPDIWMIDENKKIVNLVNDLELDELDEQVMQTLEDLKAKGIIADLESVKKIPPVKIGPHASGILPIKLDIPRQGKLFQFQKLFPGEGGDKRPTVISFWYLPNILAKGFKGFSWITLACMTLIGGAIIGFSRFSPEGGKKFLPKMFLTLGIIFLAWLVIQCAGWGVMLVLSIF